MKRVLIIGFILFLLIGCTTLKEKQQRYEINEMVAKNVCAEQNYRLQSYEPVLEPRSVYCITPERELKKLYISKEELV